MTMVPAEVRRTLGTLLAEGRRRLVAAGIPNAPLDARVLLAHVLGLDTAQLFNREPEPATETVEQLYLDLIKRRIARVPVSRLVGRREFWSLEFEITPDTLDPRPDSETLIEAVLVHRPDQGAALSILDLGTGSGCLLLAALSEYPRARGLGIDRNPGAVTAAARNATRLGLADRATFREGEWAEGLTDRFDIVLCNPPYIPSGDLADLAPEVTEHDPHAALEAGPDGLRDYRAVLVALSAVLAADGLAFLELGHGQAEDVASIARRNGLMVREVRRDLAGIERCLVVGRHEH